MGSERGAEMQTPTTSATGKRSLNPKQDPCRIVQNDKKIGKKKTCPFKRPKKSFGLHFAYPISI